MKECVKYPQARQNEISMSIKYRSISSRFTGNSTLFRREPIRDVPHETGIAAIQNGRTLEVKLEWDDQLLLNERYERGTGLRNFHSVRDGLKL